MFEKIRLGMIGGGIDSMIGNIHRHAAQLDRQYELIAGVFSQNLERSLLLANQLGLNPKRIYSTYQEMFRRERSFDKKERLQAIAIVTPNASHYTIAEAALEAGFDLIIEKPMTTTLKDAKKLVQLAKKHHNHICITYPLTGYPMIKEARHLITSGKLGIVKKIVGVFAQGWLTTDLENQNHKQAAWRMDANHHASGTIADIGTHLFHLSEYITDLKATHICAEINSHLPNRQLEDDATILVKYENNAKGVLIASQVAAGEESKVEIEIYTDKASLHWQQTNPNMLTIKWLDQGTQILRAGTNNLYLNEQTRYHCRTPHGHPEGFIEAFANHYRNFALTIANVDNPYTSDYPTVEDGLRGVAFVETVLKAGSSTEKWHPFLN